MVQKRRILIVVLSACLIFGLIKLLPQRHRLSRMVFQHTPHSQPQGGADNINRIHNDHTKVNKLHKKDEDLNQISNGFNNKLVYSKIHNQIHNEPNQPHNAAINLHQVSNGFKHTQKSRYSARLTFNCDGRVKGDDTKPTLVLGIVSSNEHTQLRNIHRKSLKIYESYPLNVIICFLLDQPTPNLLIESELHKDMVFLNTTSWGWGIKFGQKLYKWFAFVNNAFPDSDLVGKMDDDVFLCLPEIFERLRNVTGPRLYYGWQPIHKYSFKLFVRPDRRTIVNVTKWVDEMFIVVGKTLAERIAQRTYCFDNSPRCDPLVELVDTGFAGDSSGLWLKIYPDVNMVSDNKYLIRFTPNIQKFLNKNFCDKHLLMHPIKSHEHINQMYNYTWNNNRDSVA